jgi:hypothetical protein
MKKVVYMQYSCATAVQHEYPVYSTQRTQSAVAICYLYCSKSSSQDVDIYTSVLC